MINIKNHAQVILKLGTVLSLQNTDNVIEIGVFLQETGADDLTTGGFWLYKFSDLQCYCSDKFIKVLEYDRKEVETSISFFNRTADIEQLQKGYDLLAELINESSEECFRNVLKYTTKNGIQITVNCIGSVCYKNGEPFLSVGTHSINK